MFSVEALLCCLYYGITEVLIFLWHLQFGVRKHLCCTCPCKGHSEFVSMIVVVLGSKKRVRPSDRDRDRDREAFS